MLIARMQMKLMMMIVIVMVVVMVMVFVKMMLMMLMMMTMMMMLMMMMMTVRNENENEGVSCLATVDLQQFAKSLEIRRAAALQPARLLMTFRLQVFTIWVLRCARLWGFKAFT